MSCTRRQVLARGAALASVAALTPGAIRARRREPGRSLVVLQLTGGNDGLSTVVPWDEDGYGRARHETRLRQDDVLPLSGVGRRRLGLHAGLERLHRHYEEGRLAIVEGVGYPDMRRSHFASLDVWHAADLRGRNVGEGWIGRLAAEAWPGEERPELVVHLGGRAPWSIHSARRPPVAIHSPTAYRWFGPRPPTQLVEEIACEEPAPADRDASAGRKHGDPEHAGRDAALARLRERVGDARESSRAVRSAALAHRPRVAYPRDELGAVLRDVAGLVHGGLGTRVFSVSMTGFDTHSDQRGDHGTLMRVLDRGLGAFLADLAESETGRATVVLAFSEFGRRVAENASAGTDHGKAGAAFLVAPPSPGGSGLRGGLFGAPPSLARLDDGDLEPTTDFRSVYAAVIEGWFGVDAAAVLGGTFPPLPLFA